MAENYFVWDDICEGLAFHGAQKIDDDTIKKKGRPSQVAQTSNVYCPHAHLILNFHETLNMNDKIKFRKRYLRKMLPTEAHIIILQDIKDLVLYLLATPISPQFINFFHLPVVDRFLRALLLYFQYYIEIWESLMEERAATMKKAPNPLAQGNRLRHAIEIRVLRTLLGREYGNLILGYYDTDYYHHMTSGHKRNAPVTQSQGEKDLRVFEILINIAQRIVWIALNRKNYTVIEIELHRLFRTSAYNTAQRRNNDRVMDDMLEDDILVLHGQRTHFKRKLLQNCPLLQESVFAGHKSRRLFSGAEDVDTDDPCVVYLKNALTVEEERLLELGIKIGILGQSRADYDVMLMPSEKKYSMRIDEDEEVKDNKQERLTSILSDRKRSGGARKGTKENIEATVRMPCFGTDMRSLNLFLRKGFDAMPMGYQKAREDSRRTWFAREKKRQKSKQLDSYSITTTID